jgi:hypothetical protein
MLSRPPWLRSSRTIRRPTYQHVEASANPSLPSFPALYLEIHHTLQAGNLLRILCDHIRHDGVLPLRHLLGNFRLMCHAHLTLLQRALEVNIGNLIA